MKRLVRVGGSTGAKAKAKAPIAWWGGKQYLAGIIAALLPDHAIYCEPFGGAGSVLFAKAASQIEIYNDLNDGLVNLFRVIRDPASYRELNRRLELTPYARAEWLFCKRHYQAELDPVEKARMFFTLIEQGYAAHERKSSWNTGGPGGDNVHDQAGEFRRSVARLEAVSQRLEKVSIENNPALNLMRRWDGPQTCFYLDPPYLAATRHSKERYRFEMSDEQHQELIEFCLAAQGKIVLSGYNSPLYEQALEVEAGWTRRDYKTQAHSAVGTVKEREKRQRTESVWLNVAAQHSLDQRPSQLELWAS